MKVVLMCSLGETTGHHSEWNRTLIISIDFTSVYIPFYVNKVFCGDLDIL